MAKGIDSRARYPGLNLILLLISSLTNYLTSLCLCFLICKRERVAVAYLIVLKGLNELVYLNTWNHAWYVVNTLNISHCFYYY